MARLILVPVFWVVLWPLRAQLSQVYMPPPSHIRTAVCTVNDFPYKYPIAALDEYLFISFDDLDADEKNYYYRIRRYDHHWQPSDLLPSEYIDGYDTDYIPEVENSRATLVDYTHYAFKLPNENTRITKSGNYIIEILDEDEEPVFNFPVIIYERSAVVSVAVKRPTEPRLMPTHQFVHFKVRPSGMRISDPSTDLTVRVMKNENIFEWKEFHAPAYRAGEELDYYFPQQAVFPGGDEFLHFELKDVRGYNPGIDSLRLRDIYHAWLLPYRPAPYYRQMHDIDGSFVIRAIGVSEPEVEADYVRVYFRLPADVVPPDKDVYVIGRFNRWQPREADRLKKNPETGLYETSRLLKQGYYDYYFVGLTPSGRIDWTAVWPSFSQTENRYTVVVYYHPPGARYVRVIGMGQGVSRPLK
ncbi:MAG: DUF5103 domain-containing protein [Chlorobi bacterium]|nr:DUF5103 domain-containing protein [Chlorobiota bacterium]